jgi:cyclic beta-1,2-glucan synthetase
LFSQLNPINHARTRAELRRYKVEPYVIAADIYSAPDHLGHGGWTWYTGSAGWMQRAGGREYPGAAVRGIVAISRPLHPERLAGLRDHPAPTVGPLHIKVENPKGVSCGVASARLDGALLDQRPLQLELNDDGQLHELAVTLG